MKQVRELLKRKSELEKGKNVDFGNEGKISVFNKIPGRYVTEEERAELLLVSNRKLILKIEEYM